RGRPHRRAGRGKNRGDGYPRRADEPPPPLRRAVHPPVEGLPMRLPRRRRCLTAARCPILLPSLTSRLVVALAAVAPVALLPGGARAASRADAGSAAAPAPATCSGLPLLTNSETTDNAFPGIRSIAVRGGTGDVHVSPSADTTTKVRTAACW